jgi:hypothetical protein
MNPVKKLTEQIRLLKAAGKKQLDIMKVMGGQIDSATKAAREIGQPVDFTGKHYPRFSPDSASKNIFRVLEGRKLRQG